MHGQVAAEDTALFAHWHHQCACLIAAAVARVTDPLGEEPEWAQPLQGAQPAGALLRRYRMHSAATLAGVQFCIWCAQRPLRGPRLRWRTPVCPEALPPAAWPFALRQLVRHALPWPALPAATEHRLRELL